MLARPTGRSDASRVGAQLLGPHTDHHLVEFGLDQVAVFVDEAQVNLTDRTEMTDPFKLLEGEEVLAWLQRCVHTERADGNECFIYMVEQTEGFARM